MVQNEGFEDAHDCQKHAAEPARHQAGDSGGEDLQGPQRRQEPQPAQAGEQEVGAVTMRDRVNVVEGGRGGERHPEAGKQRPDKANDQREHAAVQRSAAALIPDDRDLLHRRVHDGPLGIGIVLEHEAQDRHEHQQQWKQGEEAVVGDQRRQVARLVVAELLDDSNR